MPKFSKKSLERLSECDERLQMIANELIKEMDVVVLCGHRNKADQNKAFDTGKSRVRWPNGKHNKKPSLAVDLAPYPIDWDNIKGAGGFAEMCKRVEKIAKRLNIKIRLGRDFKGLVDMPHIELV
jgi:peptidoglycan LD-endopeptidase CwlK